MALDQVGALVCHLELRRTEVLGDKPETPRGGAPMDFTFINLDPRAATAEVIGNAGQEAVTFDQAPGQLTFVERTALGSLNTTSVFVSTRSTRMAAVHSRHVLIAPGDAVVSQYVGYCDPKPLTTPLPAVPAPAAEPEVPAAPPAAEAPAAAQDVSAIPPAFRGRWDELVADDCRGRGVRYELDATTFREFEVRWQVTRVRIHSPTEIEIFTTTLGDNGNQVSESWGFRLGDGGRTLSSREPGGDFYRRCPPKVPAG